MTTVKYSKLIWISIIIFIGLTTAAIVYGYQRDNSVQKRRAKGFTIVSKETIRFLDSKMQSHPSQADYVITVRYQKSDGTWKEVKAAYKTGGRVLREEISFGIPGDGAYKIDKATGDLIFLSQMPPKEVTSYVTVTNGHDHPRFLRDDVVQGYSTYVLRYDVDSNGSYEEEYYAPDLDGYPIKSVKVAPYGSSFTEALKITLGEPDDSGFASLPNFAVNYDHFKTKVAVLDRDGSHDTAGAMRKDLEQFLIRTKRKARP